MFFLPHREGLFRFVIAFAVTVYLFHSIFLCPSVSPSSFFAMKFLFISSSLCLLTRPLSFFFSYSSNDAIVRSLRRSTWGSFSRLFSLCLCISSDPFSVRLLTRASLVFFSCFFFSLSCLIPLFLRETVFCRLGPFSLRTVTKAARHLLSFQQRHWFFIAFLFLLSANAVSNHGHTPLPRPHVVLHALSAALSRFRVSFLKSFSF